MTNQNFHWAGNLKFLRNRLKISQEDLAEKLKISRSKLAAHESGNTVNPPVEDLVRFSDFYKISIDSLLKVNLSKIGELKLRELEVGSDVYMSGGSVRVLAITVDKQNNENIEYVTKKAKAGYREGFNDPEFIGSLPRFTLPNLSAKRTYRMFPTEGASMLPIPEGSEILTEYVTDWRHLKDGTLCVVVLRSEQQFLFKSVYNHVEINRSFLLRSLNPEFTDQQVSVGDILELWKFHSYWAKEIPEQAGSLDRIERTINNFRNEMVDLITGQRIVRVS